jgi:predicted transcriptional regulator
MQGTTDLRQFRSQLGMTQTQVAAAMELQKSSYQDLETNRSRVPRPETVQRILSAMNLILTERGSSRRVSYDELWAAICVGRPVGDLAAVPTPAGSPIVRDVGTTTSTEV